MYNLKNTFISSEPVDSNANIQGKFTYAGYDEKTKLIKIHYVYISEADLGKKKRIQVKPIELAKHQIPENLSLADAVKTVSYIINQVSKKTKSDKNSLLCAQLSSRCLSQYHFTEVEESKRKKEKCLPLFVVDGNPKLLKNTSFYDNYVDWYVPNVTRDDVSASFKNASLTMPRTIKINFEEESELGE